jgi:hypothetical protein
MPESIDFEQIGKSLLNALEKAGGGGRPVASVVLIAEQLSAWAKAHPAAK